MTTLPPNEHEEIALLSARVKLLESQQQQLWTLVWGNGRPGLRDDVAEIKRWMVSMRKWMSLIAATLLVQLLGAATAFLWLVFTHVTATGAAGKGAP